MQHSPASPLRRIGSDVSPGSKVRTTPGAAPRAAGASPGSKTRSGLLGKTLGGDGDNNDGPQGPDAVVDVAKARAARVKKNWDKVRKVGRAAMAIAAILKKEPKKQATKKTVDELDTFQRIASIEPHARSTAQVDVIMDRVITIQFFRALLDKGMTKLQLRELCRGMNVESYPRGKTIFAENDEGYTFYVILSGQIGIFVRGNKDLHSAKKRPAAPPDSRSFASRTEEGGEGGADKKPAIPKWARRSRKPSVVPDAARAAHIGEVHRGKLVAELSGGQWFGEIALMDGKKTRTATAAAIKDSTLLTIHKSDYDRVIKYWHSERYAEKVRRLSSINCLGELTHGDLDDLAYVATARTYRVGETIIQEGDQVDHDAWVMFINRGECMVTREVRVTAKRKPGNGNGTPRSVGTLTPRTPRAPLTPRAPAPTPRTPRTPGSTKPRELSWRRDQVTKMLPYELCRLRPGDVAYALIPMTNGRMNTSKHTSGNYVYSVKAATLVEMLTLSKHDILYRIRNEAMANIQRSLAAFPSYSTMKKLYRKTEKWEKDKKEIVADILANSNKGDRLRKLGYGATRSGVAKEKPLHGESAAQEQAKQNARKTIQRRRTQLEAEARRATKVSVIKRRLTEIARSPRPAAGGNTDGAGQSPATSPTTSMDTKSGAQKSRTPRMALVVDKAVSHHAGRKQSVVSVAAAAAATAAAAAASAAVAAKSSKPRKIRMKPHRPKGSPGTGSWKRPPPVCTGIPDEDEKGDGGQKGKKRAAGQRKLKRGSSSPTKSLVKI